MITPNEPWVDLAIYEDRIDREKERRLPRCSMCGAIIDQYDVVQMNGKLICDACLDDMRVLVEENYPEGDE